MQQHPKDLHDLDSKIAETVNMYLPELLSEQLREVVLPTLITKMKAMDQDWQAKVLPHIEKSMVIIMKEFVDQGVMGHALPGAGLGLQEVGALQVQQRKLIREMI
mmetsp:Transcript_22388/g.16868  ORF Transcript_22388/g.16868 Transcript_22388/m.16868 type:complete len:105 (+) Transcript_22388:108-422(+)